ncbi:hypothetical protein HPB47_023768 [Ixodes persulcatus]|uniref:Uncharacterized protein n=1 Tax=Ixodes persulcatus TaxID=34615 RepID=A0AC60Q639_IXOPE|nr:hypothetical protein HPB47_023768 [Ixodes persulcatus]
MQVGRSRWARATGCSPPMFAADLEFFFALRPPLQALVSRAAKRRREIRWQVIFPRRGSGCPVLSFVHTTEYNGISESGPSSIRHSERIHEARRLRLVGSPTKGSQTCIVQAVRCATDDPCRTALHTFEPFPGVLLRRGPDNCNMTDLPELQRRLLQRSRPLGFEPWRDSPLRQTGDRSSSDSDSSGDDIDCEGTACAGSRLRCTNPRTSRARASPDHQPSEPDRLGHTGWCTCGLCVPMPTALESVCCREVPAATRKQPSDCLTAHPHLHTLCLDEVVLDVAIHMLQDHGIRVENTR